MNFMRSAVYRRAHALILSDLENNQRGRSFDWVTGEIRCTWVEEYIAPDFPHWDMEALSYEVFIAADAIERSAKLGERR